MIAGYKVSAIHTFQVGTLKSLGFKGRVTLVNNTLRAGRIGGDVIVDCTIVTPGRGAEIVSGVAKIPVGSRTVIPFDRFESVVKSDQEQILTFHLVPEKFYNQQFIDLERSELWAVFTAQDHYIEYYLSDGYSAGVLYQSGAFNYALFSQERTTLIQAPKIYTSSEVTTYLMMINNSFEESYETAAKVNCCIMGDNGRLVDQWVEKVYPFQRKLLNLSERVAKSVKNVRSSQATNFAIFYGLCSNAALLPLTITHNSRSNALAVEHSLPPNYYAESFIRNVRKSGIQNLTRNCLFASNKESH